MSEPNADPSAAAQGVPPQGVPPQSLPPVAAGVPAPSTPAPSTPAPLPPPPGYVMPEPDGPPQFPAPPPAKKKRTGLIVGIIVAAVVVLIGCVVGGLLLARALGGELAKQPENAEVNDCLGGTTMAELDVNKLVIVACDDPSAEFQVVQKVPGLTQAQAEEGSKCTVEGAEVTFWFGRDGSTGSVLCLKSV